MTMKLLITVLLSVLVLPALAYDLSQHQWSERLLVFVAEDPQDPDLADQLRNVAQESAAVKDRDLRVYRLFALSGWIDQRPLSADDVAQLRRTLGIAPGQRQLILIGLDGDIKRRGDLSTKLSEVFAQIDAMPMRRAELRERHERDAIRHADPE